MLKFNTYSEITKRLFLKYLLYSGLRKYEAIKSFNRIIELAKNTRLSEYYDSVLNCLMPLQISQRLQDEKPRIASSHS